MKNILVILALTISSVACSADNTPIKQPPTATTVTKDAVDTPTTTGPTQKRVCIMVWDAKLNKEVEKCRTITLHQKYQGTQVPLK